MPRFRRALTGTHGVSEAEVAAVEDEIEQEIAEALQYARESPDPEPASAMEFVYAN